jgi:hypothetical protein
MSTKNTHCDYCKNELKSPPKAKKSKSGIFYSVDSEYYFPFVCPFCGGHFCTKHRLPENHECKDFPRSYRNTAHISTEIKYNNKLIQELRENASARNSLWKSAKNKIKKKFRV